MDNKFQLSRDKVLYLDKVILCRGDLLSALSWFDFIAKDQLSDADKDAKENLLKVINYLTRQA